jgi:TP901 family phage tail tape measure protein
MADLNANINVGIETTQALNQLKSLQKQISQFHQSVSKSSNQAALAQRDLQRNFLNGVNAIQGFSAELKTVRTTAETFTNSLEKNKLSMREYFRYAGGATQRFGKNFVAEFNTIEKTAVERVKTLQTQYIKMGRDASGAMQAIAVRPTVLDMKDLGTQTAIAAQKQVLFNQLVKQGSTNLLNFGKNTQWAGRQLMVGFTLPLATLGMTAGRVFFDMEQAAIKFRKVYGDLFTPEAERQQALEGIVELGEAYTAYGVAVADSLSMASDAAAAGFAGVDLQNQTAAALKLSVLGQLDLQKSLETTISLQNAFQLSSEELAGEIDFLNAVENQTVVALDDMTEAVPRVAPVIKQLGGDVRDLAFFLAAMKEGGINAAQGANALKSGLASLINPTERAAQMLSGLGINIRSIINENQGDIAGTVYNFAKALDDLDPLKRAQAIEQLFGKFQFARISALFDNITRDGTQAQRVLDLAGSSAEDLASISEKELGVSAASAMNKFRSAVEKLKVALVPIGELFVQIATPFVDFGTKMLDAFNNLPGGIKTVIGTVITILGGIGPVALMTFGLINNGIANMIKFFATVRMGYLKITGQAQGIGDETQYMTQEQLEAAAAAASLDQAHAGLIQRFTAEKVAVDALRDAYSQAKAAGDRFAMINPGMMMPGRAPKKFANGGFVSGSGSGDTVPAMLTPGEFVIKKKEAQVFLPLLQAINDGKIPGFANGGIVGSNDKLVDMFGEFAIRLQEKSQNMGRRSSKIEDPAEVLSVLATRVGEARGIVPSQAQVSKGKFDSIADEYSEIVSKFVNNLNSEFETTFSSIENSDERFKNAWLSAGKKVEQEVQKISSDVDKGVVRKTFGLDPDFMGTAPTMPRRAGGTELERARKAAFNLKDTGVRSYNTEQVRGASQAMFQRITGKSAKDMQMGHALGSVEQSLQSVVNDPRASNAIKKAAASLGVFVTNKTVEGIKESTQQSSPSREAYNAGVNIGKGSIDGIKSQTDEAAVAGQQVGQSITSGATKPRSGPRRFSTDPEVMAALNGTSQAQINTPPRGPRRATREADSTAPAPKLKNQFEDLGNKVSKASLGLSAVTGILSMFGGEMSAITSAISLFSGGLFALIEISSLLRSTQLGLAVATRAASIASTMGGAANVAGTVANQQVLQSVASTLGTGGIVSKIGNGLKFMLRFLGPVGIAISLLAIGIPLIVNLFQEQRNKMEAFGKIVDVTADQIKFLGEQSQTTVTTTSGFDRATLGQGETATEAATERATDEQFLQQFKTQIDATKAGAADSVNQALELLSFKLSSAGLSDQVVSSTIAGIIKASKRTDLEFDFNKVGLSPANTASLLANIQSRVGRAATETGAPIGYNPGVGSNYMPGSAGISQMGGRRNNLGSPVSMSTQELRDVGSSVAGFAEGLAIQLEAGKITVEEYSEGFDQLRLSLIKLEDTGKKTAMDEAINKIFPEDKEMSDAIKGVEDLDQQLLLLELAGVGGAESMQKFVDMTKDGKTTKAQFTAEIKKETAAQKKLNLETAAAISISEQETESIALQDKINTYEELVAAGMDAALAYKIAGDAALTEGYKTALAAGGLQEWINGVKELDALSKKWEGINPVATGGGGSNPIQDAIKGLKEQKQEILNTAAAYSQLRNNGMSAADALKFAQNPELMSAMNAGLKVGSTRWNQIIGLIKEAEAATKSWQNSTVQGKTEQFEDVYNRVMALFDAEEAVLEAAFESATASDNKLIESLQGQIDALNRQVEDYSRDLDGIAEQEEAINKAYDEKVKALEETKKVNEDILRQQKSQLSLADALSQGDIGAAASALQESRAANAAAALGAQGNMLQLSREAELAGVRSPEGLTRVQIEEKVKQLKKDIANIEFGALRDAKDRVDAAEKELNAKREALTVAGTTKTELEAQKNAIDLAKARAEVYDSELQNALANVQGIVSGWKSLDTTITTNHVINTTNTGTGPIGPATPAATPPATTNPRVFVPTRSSMIGSNRMTFMAKGGMVKPSFFSAGGFAKGTDTVPAMLTPGEFVINRDATKKFGPLLSAINDGGRGFTTPVYPEISRTYPSANIGGGLYSNNNVAEIGAPIDNSVYNYSLSVNVAGTNATPDQIANVVMRKLQGVELQRVRGQVVR